MSFEVKINQRRYFTSCIYPEHLTKNVSARLPLLASDSASAMSPEVCTSMKPTDWSRCSINSTLQTSVSTQPSLGCGVFSPKLHIFVEANSDKRDCFLKGHVYFLLNCRIIQDALWNKFNAEIRRYKSSSFPQGTVHQTIL